MSDSTPSPLTGVERQLTPDSQLISTSTLEGDVTYCNPELYAFTGYSWADVGGKPQKMMGAGGLPPQVRTELYAQLKAGHAHSAIMCNRCKNGDHYWADVYSTPIYKGGQLVGIESSRAKPDPEVVARARAIYPRMLAGKKFFTPLDPWLRLGMAGKLQLLWSLLLLALFAGLYWQMPEQCWTLAGYLAGALLLGAAINWGVTEGLRQAAAKSRAEIDSNLARQLYSGRQDEVGQLELVAHVMRSKLRTALGRVGEAADELVRESSNAKSLVEQTRTELASQDHAIEQIATATEEMSSTVREVASNTHEASDAAEQADQSAANGQQLVGETIALIDSLKQHLMDATEVIHTVNRESESIDEVLVVIRGIAEQTNLLALNAAIEAARAGEMGRGFAVVADEVRSLASRTQGSTADIQNMIERLQQTTHKAVAAMELSDQKAQQASSQSEESRIALATITDQVGLINQLNSMIASAVEEQSSVSAEIAEKVQGIRVNSEHTGENAQRTLESTLGVGEQADKLREVARSFKV